MNSKAIIAASADACIIRMLQSTTKGWASVIQVCSHELLTSKNAYLQMKCASYIYVMLTQWDTSKHNSHGVMEKNIDVFVKVLIAAMSSKDEKTRAIARAR